MSRNNLSRLALGAVLVIAVGCSERAELDLVQSAHEPLTLETKDASVYEKDRWVSLFGEDPEGANVAVGGTGLRTQPAFFDVDVPTGDGNGDIHEAWLYWVGRSHFPEGDDTIVINGVEHTGTEVARYEHSVSPVRWAFHYKLDATTLVSAGSNHFEVSGFDMGELGLPGGIGLVVVHAEAGGYQQIEVVELADFFYWADISSPYSAVHSYQFDGTQKGAVGRFVLFAADCEEARPDVTWLDFGKGTPSDDNLVDGPHESIENLLVSANGAEFDVLDTGPTPLPPGIEYFSFQVESPAEGDGDSGILALAVYCVSPGGDPPNEAPECDAGGPYEGGTRETIVLDGSGSFDPDGEIVSWVWDYGDTNTVSGEMVEVSFDAPGSYDVLLCVTDDDGEETCCETTVEISDENQPPECDAGGPYEGTAGIAVTFDGSDSFDPDGEIVEWIWDFGDGSDLVFGEIVEHAYADSGQYVVTLCVVDNSEIKDGDDGNGGSETCCETTATIGAGNVEPDCDIEITDEEIFVGESVVIDGSGSGDPDGEIISWVWSFGDGGSDDGPTVLYSWDEPGIYLVTLTVTDNDGAASECGQEVEVVEIDK